MINYREYTGREALDEAKARNEIVVTRSDFVRRWGYKNILMICTMDDYYNTGVAYSVEIDRPPYLHGSEGILSTTGLRFMGRLSPDFDYDELTEDELEEQIPDDGQFIWGFSDNSTAYKDKPIEWKRFNFYSEFMREK